MPKSPLAVDNFITEAMTRHQIPGLSLAVVQDGAVRLLSGYGLAHLEHQVPATAHTVYEIASLTKLFTATAVMRLVEAGRLALTDPLAAHLPDLPPAWSAITIRHILAHQSGLKSYTQVKEYWRSTRLDVSRPAILDLVRHRPLDFQPGQRHAYDNTGYYLLGLLIEQISGQSYGQFLAEQIFEPLGMTATRVNDPYAIVPHRAAGYTGRDGHLRNAEYYSPAGTFSAGVLLSSAADLATWAATLHTDALLSPASRELMWRPHPSAAANEREFHFSLGLGWFLVDWQGRTFAGHNGDIVGFAASLVHFPAERLTGILLCNRDELETPHLLALGALEKFTETQE